MSYDLSTQCKFLKLSIPKQPHKPKLFTQLIHEKMQMPNLFWTNLSSTHISLPPTSCLVKSSKLSSALTMVVSNLFEDYWCMAKYRKDSLEKRTAVSSCINRETSNCLWLCLKTASSPTEKAGLQTTSAERPEIFCPKSLIGKLPAHLMILWTSTRGTEPSQGQEMWEINLPKRTLRIFLCLATFKYLGKPNKKFRWNLQLLQIIFGEVSRNQ